MKSSASSIKIIAAICYLLFSICFFERGYAQIIYTDIPDATPNATYSLDLNNDTIIDFVFQYEAVDKVMCKPLNNNAYSGQIVSGAHLPWALNAAMNICDTNATWFGTNNPGTMAWGSTIGNWIGASNKYVALQLNVGANTYYGWARLDFLASSSFTIKDYAYESSPNNCIQAGQTNLSVGENLSQHKFTIAPNPMTTSSTIYSPIVLNNATMTIYNTTGQPVKQIKNISGSNFYFSRSNLPSGFYFIQLTNENKINLIEKLLIED